MRVRTLGRAWLGPAFDYLLFLRPRQWPILSGQLAVGILTAPACVAFLSGMENVDVSTNTLRSLFVAWLAWVVCLNGGTLAFNSAYDRDTTDIAYLRRPPAPPPHLALFALCLMLFGAGIAITVSPPLGFLTGGCILLSVLYSHPRTRWKSIPGLDLGVNLLGYGAGTTLAGLLSGGAAFPVPAGGLPLVDRAGWLLVSGFGFLFGSFYPLTQIYQLLADQARGDRTLASALGTRRSLLLALVLGFAAAGCLLPVAAEWSGASGDEGVGGKLPLLGLALVVVAWLVHIIIWLGRASQWNARDSERGMYRALALWALVDMVIVWNRY